MPRDVILLPRQIERVPRALAELHREHPTGTRLAVDLPDFDPHRRALILEGAGFTAEPTNPFLVIERVFTLPDLVEPNLSVLMVGLNPSEVAAETGVPFAGATNRFWPAAREAQLVSLDRDPWAAFDAGIGWTDIVKRASARANGLTRADYTHGAQRLHELVEWLTPTVVCFAGITGYRSAIDRDAELGVQPTSFGGAITYVMPNPSGANAHASRADLVAHFTRVRDLGGG